MNWKNIVIIAWRFLKNSFMVSISVKRDSHDCVKVTNLSYGCSDPKTCHVRKIIATDGLHYQTYWEDVGVLYFGDTKNTRSERRREDVSEKDHRNTARNQEDTHRRRRWIVVPKLERRLWPFNRRRHEKKLHRDGCITSETYDLTMGKKKKKKKREDGGKNEESSDVLESTNKWKNKLLWFVQDMFI